MIKRIKQSNSSKEVREASVKSKFIILVRTKPLETAQAFDRLMHERHWRMWQTEAIGVRIIVVFHLLIGRRQECPLP